MNSGQARNNYLLATHEPYDPGLHNGNALAHGVAGAASWVKAWDNAEAGTRFFPGRALTHGNRLMRKRDLAWKRFEGALEAYEACVRGNLGGAGEGG